jgi:hypothetical protein
MRLRHLVLSGLLLTSACAAHRPVSANAFYTLEDKSGYSLLVPSQRVEEIDPNLQTTLVTLPGGKRKADLNLSQSCTISGSIFSLSSDSSGFPNRWIMKSMSVQGWQTQRPDLDIHSEWNRFLQDLMRLERQSCFPRGQTLFAVRKTIAEAIPLPATEMAFFVYSFGGTGFVDLAPGMELRLEQPWVGKGAPTSRIVSFEAEYKVISAADTGVALHLYRSANQKNAKSVGANTAQLFELSKRFRSKALLRLYLVSVGADKFLNAVLLGANSVEDLMRATDKIEQNGRSACPDGKADQVDCIMFGSGTAASLMSSISVNGKEELLPFGITVGQKVDVSSHGNLERTIKTVSLSRALAGRGYAEVHFPQTKEAAQQLVLLPGDVLAWK